MYDFLYTIVNKIKGGIEMSNMKKLLIFTLIMVIILGILAIGDLDYTFSQNIINTNSLFGEFFNILGEVPANLAMLIGATILFGSRKKNGTLSTVIKSIVAIPFMFLVSELTVINSVRYIYEFSETGFPRWALAISAFGGLLLFGAAVYSLFKFKPEQFMKWRKQGLILLILVIMEILVVNVLKIIWARPRMRSITSIEQFKHWYEINGPMNSKEFKSFPSGHTANAFVMLAYTLFIPKDRKVLMRNFTIFAIFWGVSTAFSRVILGAHFLSDVFVGGYITILLFYVLSSIVLKNE
jgi:membrane-associated phospholipid phosphatase